MRTAEKLISDLIDDKRSYCMVLGLIKQAQREALEAAAKIADNPGNLFERGETINLEKQSGRIAAAIRSILHIEGEK